VHRMQAAAGVKLCSCSFCRSTWIESIREFLKAASRQTVKGPLSHPRRPGHWSMSCRLLGAIGRNTKALPPHSHRHFISRFKLCRLKGRFRRWRICRSRSQKKMRKLFSCGSTASYVDLCREGPTASPEAMGAGATSQRPQRAPEQARCATSPFSPYTENA
jgi:hypothetical protein